MMCFLPWTLLWNPYRMVAGIKTSLNIKLRLTVGLQTLTMLMNAPCSLIMRERELVFLGYFPDEVLLVDVVHGGLL